MKSTLTDFFTELWFIDDRVAGYALPNLLDDPAILAMATSADKGKSHCRSRAKFDRMPPPIFLAVTAKHDAE